jgi:hypothetical protein
MPEPIMLQDDIITELSSLISIPEELNIRISKETLFSSDRRCIKHDALYIQSKLAERSIYLLNDFILVIAIQEDDLPLLEEAIELKNSQIKCEDFNGSLDVTFLNEEDSRVCATNNLEIIWPQGSMIISFNEETQKNCWTSAIFAGICDSVPDQDRKIGWRHHIRLGTIHSAVATRDMAILESYKELCESGSLDYSIFDLPDDEGFTPIHFACIFRIPYIVQFLLDVGVDVTVKDSQGSTALHWASLLLDCENLSALCSNIFDTDLFDDCGNTPLFLACIAGRDSSGAMDYNRMLGCMNSLISLGADVNFQTSAGYSLIQYAVSRWQYPVSFLYCISYYSNKGFQLNEDSFYDYR